MHTLLIVSSGTAVPPELRQIIEAGSTSVDETAPNEGSGKTADRVLIWSDHTLHIADKALRWPQDEDEIRLLLQTAG